jgi:hypothetical protein
VPNGASARRCQRLSAPRPSSLTTDGYPTSRENERDTGITCTRHEATGTCAAFIAESRMTVVHANKLQRKSGCMGHPALRIDPSPTRASPDLKSVPFQRPESFDEGDGFAGCGKTHVLYQGTTLVGPSRCH